MLIYFPGGTVDMTAHEVLEGNRLKELHRAMGNDCGGNKVNENFLNFLSEFLGKDDFERFSIEHKDDYVELLDDFESKKRYHDPEKLKRTTLRIPTNLGKLLTKKLGHNRSGAFEIIANDKMRLTTEFVTTLFMGVIKYIVQSITEMLVSIPDSIEQLLVVGGFADSPMLRQELRKAFESEMKVTFPYEGSLAVLKGAVLFGHNPATVTERKSRYTYGFAMVVSFDKEKHPKSKAIFIDDKRLCNDVFDIHVRVGDTVRYGEYQTERVYFPMSDTDTTYPIVLYRSTKREPKFVDEEECEAVGYYLAQRPFNKGTCTRNEQVKVKLAFGNADIKVVVIAQDGTTETPAFKF